MPTQYQAWSRYELISNLHDQRHYSFNISPNMSKRSVKYIYILTHQVKRRIWLYQACAKNTLSSHSASISFNKALLLFVMNTAPPTSIPTSPTTISGRLPQTYYDISCETALLVTDWFFLFFSYETLSCLNLNPMDGRQWKTLLFCWHHHLTNTTLLEI